MVSHGGGQDGDEPDLLAVDPLEFEELVAELSRAMGMQAVTTVRSGDGRVDVDALDPDPIHGGKIAVQVKRYRRTVPPTAVRDLYGTVRSIGADKGVQVTTSGFGRSSYVFVSGKPMTLVSGTELVDLLHRYGLRERPGTAAGDAAATDEGRAPAPGTPMTTAGRTTPTRACRVCGGAARYGSTCVRWCALVCTGGRALGDDHFVFYDNPATPDGTVRMMPALGEDKAAVWVSFDRLPARADRVVLVAAIDPEADPDADLSGFTDARIRLTDPAGAEADRLEVSDGRPGETALLLGSFRRRSDGNWASVAGGTGYQGQEGQLNPVRGHGIEVE
ncbi:restriction endonuclease [Actinacidiphila sp. ITFR-21]|uniref:restriction endonuclease n=1 Tax=Actinacidiphila sp. ITFR-21 TaxID=3075199 RepID=UPI00288AA8AE|nr:restriction endonuclease [Streptomyces sp. ITFR-21]WNI14577.1 restriction endonuclease [Streptomyces sp. ITFR-21]